MPSDHSYRLAQGMLRKQIKDPLTAVSQRSTCILLLQKLEGFITEEQFNHLIGMRPKLSTRGEDTLDSAHDKEVEDNLRKAMKSLGENDGKPTSSPSPTDQ
jgi:hypothetical protein